MMKKRYISAVKVLLIFAVGSFFLLGSMGGGGGPSVNKKKEYNKWDLPSQKQKEYDELKKKREYAEKVRSRRYNDYWDEREKEVGMRRTLKESRVFDGNVEKGEYKEYGKDPYSREPVRQASGAHDLHNDLTKIDKNIKQIDKQIDDLFEENKRTCFPPDTLVLLHDGSYKAIKDIEAGDSVSTYDIAKDTIGKSSVKMVSVSDNNHFYQINYHIKATAYERFLTQDGWKKIRDIEVGDTIFNGNSFEVVATINKEVESSTVYNLTINESHNFFVSRDGQSSVLVHNSSGGHGGGSSGGSGGGK